MPPWSSLSYKPCIASFIASCTPRAAISCVRLNGVIDPLCFGYKDAALRGSMACSCCFLASEIREGDPLFPVAGEVRLLGNNAPSEVADRCTRAAWVLWSSLVGTVAGRLVDFENRSYWREKVNESGLSMGVAQAASQGDCFGGRSALTWFPSIKRERAGGVGGGTCGTILSWLHMN